MSLKVINLCLIDIVMPRIVALQNLNDNYYFQFLSIIVQILKKRFIDPTDKRMTAGPIVLVFLIRCLVFRMTSMCSTVSDCD